MLNLECQYPNGIFFHLKGHYSLFLQMIIFCAGSEISFFKYGVCQGVAFKDLYGGRYYPAASMYTLPNQPNCVVKFNFGPDFECFPEDFGERPVPMPMIDVPYHGFDSRVENGVSDEKKH